MEQNFTAVSAAFDAFKSREQSGVLLKAALAYVVGLVVFLGAFIALNLSSLARFAESYLAFMGASMQGRPLTPDDPAFASYMTAFLSILPAYFLVIVAVIFLLAAFEAAVQRWLIRGEAGQGFFGLELNADTLRVFCCYLMWIPVFIALEIALIIIGFVVAFILSLAVALLHAPQTAIAVLTSILMLVFLCAFVFIAVRLSPAAATTIARRRFAFFDAWKVSKGRFWRLLGANLILWIPYFVVYAIAAGVIFSMAVSNGWSVFSTPPAWLGLGVAYVAFLCLAVMIFIGTMGINAMAARVALAEGRIAAESP